jgi:membrane protease YdiL (CAAX protease family)
MNKIKKSPLLSLIFAILIASTVFYLSLILSKVIKPFTEPIIGNDFYASNVPFKIILLTLSILAFFLINNGSLKDFGFKKAEKYSIWKLIMHTAIATIGSLLIGNLVFRGILGHLFPTDHLASFDMPSSLLKLILTVWIVSSFAEEVFVRGLLQGMMSHLQHIKIGKLSISVIISGLFFGLMHLSLLFAGKDIWFVCSILVFTTTLGLLAAWYREKYKSIWPSFFIHFLGNVIGGLPLIIMTILN